MRSVWIVMTLVAVAAVSLVAAGCKSDGGAEKPTTQPAADGARTTPDADTQPPREPPEAPEEADTQPPREPPETPEKEKPVTTSNPVVVMETSEGTIKIELDAGKAPITVENFLRYVDEQFYDGTIFHRVIGNFMIQGGGFTASLQQKQPHAPIKNEAANGLKNDRGTIAMARTGIVDSATAQFFINVVDNAGLNHKNTSDSGFGYCVFGKVIDGMDVVDRIKAVTTKTVGPFQNVPTRTMTIKSIRRAKAE